MEAETNEVNVHTLSCLNLTVTLLICIIIIHFIDEETHGYKCQSSSSN